MEYITWTIASRCTSILHDGVSVIKTSGIIKIFLCSDSERTQKKLTKNVVQISAYVKLLRYESTSEINKTNDCMRCAQIASIFFDSQLDNAGD